MLLDSAGERTDSCELDFLGCFEEIDCCRGSPRRQPRLILLVLELLSKMPSKLLASCSTRFLFVFFDAGAYVLEDSVSLDLLQHWEDMLGEEKKWDEIERQ